MEDNQSQESGVSQDTSTAVSDNSASSAPNQEAANSQDVNSTQSQESNVPFNDPRSSLHPRFKELIEQNQGFKGQLSQYEQNMQQMRSQYEQQMQGMMKELQALKPAPQKPFQPLLEELKGINPQFASLQERTLEAIERLPQLEQQLNAIRVEKDRAEAYNQFNSLLEQNKVPAELRPRYEREVKALAYELGERGSLKDLPHLFKAVHDELGKFFDTYKRQITSSYVADKKQDSTPATQTGGSPATQKKPQSRADFIASLAQEMRRNKNAN